MLQLDVVRQLPAFGPFSPCCVIVPDDIIATFLKIEMARRAGIIAHVRFLEWDTFIEQIRDEHAPGVFEKRGLRARLVALFSDEEMLARPILEPVRRYIQPAQPDASHYELDLAGRRRFQLADQLADLFLRYAEERPHLLEAWQAGDQSFARTQADRTERWQMMLWRELCTRFEPKALTPLGLAESLESGHGYVPPMVVHLFGFGASHAGAYEVVRALSSVSLVYAYGISPSSEYWAEIPFGRPEDEELFSSASVQGGAVEYQGSDDFWRSSKAPFLYRAWGFAGACHQRAIEPIPGLEYHDLFDSPHQLPPEPTLLQSMQADIVHMQTPLLDEHERGEFDDSVRVLAAPSIKREVEAIASEIVEILEQTDIEPHQIALFLPSSQREVYQTHVRAVFPSTRRIPFNVVDMPASRWSRAIEAVRLMLDLPLGQFRRVEFLRLLTHPNVLDRFPHIDPAQWIGWCDDLKILHGADRRDHADTYIEHELFHWDQGLKRLALGAFMTGSLSGETRAFEQGASHYLPYEHTQEEMASAARLIVMARSLIEEAQFCRTSTLPLGTWASFFCDMISTYLIASEPGDQMLLHRCKQQLAAMADHDFTGTPIGFRMAHDIALDAISELEVRQGQPLLQGVSVLGLERGRALPFEVVFVAGLGEGEFPESETRRPEDLRVVEGEHGEMIKAAGAPLDVPLRDHHKQLFLELFLQARTRFVASYVSRDVKTGEERQPSSLVSELLYAIEHDYTPLLDGEDDDARRLRVERGIVIRHELRRFHLRYFPSFSPESAPRGEVAALTPSGQPEARHEASAQALRSHLAAHCAQEHTSLPSREGLLDSVDPLVRERLERHLRVRHVSEESNEESQESETIRVSLFDLRSFLECPLQGSARFLLRLDEGDEDLFSKDSELFEPSQRARMMLLRDIFLEKLGREHRERRPLDFDDLYDVHARYFELQGMLPTGPFYTAARQRHLKLLETWQDNLPLLGLGRSPLMEVMRFGRPREHDIVDVAHRPFSLPVTLSDGRCVEVELSGRTEVILPDSSASLIPHTSANARGLSPKYFMRGFLDYVFLCANGRDTSLGWTVHLNPGEELAPFKKKHCQKRFAPLDARTARSFLSELTASLISGVHAYYMPIEVVFEHLQQKTPLEHVARRKRLDTWNKTSSDFGPISNARTFELPPDAHRIIEQRYGLYFEHLGQRR